MQNKIPADRIWQEWAKKADDDQLNIESILKHRDGTPNCIGFLAQQMAEKYMKGLLVFHEQKYPKIHFLNRIATLLEPFSPQIFDFAEDYNKLSQLYIIDRYPGDMLELSWEEAEDAYAAAQRIKEFVLSEIAKKPDGDWLRASNDNW